MYRLTPLVFFTLLILFIDAYAWQGIKLLLVNSSPASRRAFTILYWSMPVVVVVMIAAGTFYHFSTWPGWLRTYAVGLIASLYIAKFILLPFLLIDDVVRGGRWFVSLFTHTSSDKPHSVSRMQFIVYTGLLISGFLGANLLYGMVRNAYRYKLHRVSLKFPNLPKAFDGMKIVQISDIHSGSFARTEPVEAAVHRINALHPDVILFTGDLVNNLAEEVEPYKQIFGKLKSKYGVYSVMGNHDYGDYYSWEHIGAKEANLAALHQAHADMGWTLLLNENAMIGDGDDLIALIGVENWSRSARFPRKGNLQKANAGTEQAKLKILLSHDPSHWEAQVLQEFPDIDLTLSGHTHGFQFGVEIPGFKWSPSQYMYKQWAGLYARANQYLYVNRGFGFLGYPGRVGILPEITLIQLNAA